MAALDLLTVEVYILLLYLIYLLYRFRMLGGSGVYSATRAALV